MSTELPTISLSHLDELWFQVSGTLCNLTCNHCFISCSPTNKNFGFLSLAAVQTSLQESVNLGVKGYYFTGDGARRDNGMYRIIGRVDDVINVSGHRFGTAEIENAINSNNLVNESAVVGYRHPIKGQGIYAFVILEHGIDLKEKISITKSISESVERSIGKIARPDIIQITKGLPKTRSGKIMRRILRKIANAESKDIGDTSTLLDPSIVESLVKGQKH